MSEIPNNQKSNEVRANEFARRHPGVPRGSNATRSARMSARLEGETEDAYIARLTADYISRAPNAPPALIDRATSFIRAMASKVFEKPASAELIASRVDACMSCDAFRVAFSEPEQLGHCSECGCGVSKSTSIFEKSKILASTCPRKLWDVRVPPTV